MLFFKGFLIGVSMLVPGLSGGSAAMILGLYDKIILSAAGLVKDFKRSALFLLKISSGAACSLAVFTTFFLPVFEANEGLLRGIAIAVTLAGIPFFLKSSNVDIKKKKNVSIALLTAAAYLSFYYFGKSFGILHICFAGSPASVFAAGVILSVSLVLPGISFSYMLFYMGLYEVTLTAFRNAELFYIIPFCSGLAAGTAISVFAFKELLQTRKEEFACAVSAFLLTSLFLR